MSFIFFYASRRRHTILVSDWSSDVCSSDLIQMATIDELTNIPNRRGFMIVAQHSLKLCIRQRLPATLAYMDLDNFKSINDTHGHMAGDKVLSTFATQMSQVCRESDLLARLGGDEFVILFINTSKDEAEKHMVRLQQSLLEYAQKEKHGYEMSFSYGITDHDPKKHSSIEELLDASDALMYENTKVTSN